GLRGGLGLGPVRRGPAERAGVLWALWSNRQAGGAASGVALRLRARDLWRGARRRAVHPRARRAGLARAGAAPLLRHDQVLLRLSQGRRLSRARLPLPPRPRAPRGLPHARAGGRRRPSAPLPPPPRRRRARRRSFSRAQEWPFVEQGRGRGKGREKGRRRLPARHHGLGRGSSPAASPAPAPR
ncbi:hypothetical protein H632_c5467p0, partial [Helicosporidium sp. ATCC 50920]